MNKTTRKHWAKCTTGGGFTLAELLIVVAVIAVLVAVAIPTFTNQLEKSRQAVDISNLRGAYAAARLAEIDQAVNGVKFKDIITETKSSEATANKNGLQFWYDVDSGTLARVTDTDKSVPTAEGVGKATSAKVVADTSQVPLIGNKVLYSRFVLAVGTPGTLDKKLLVVYKEDADQNNVYTLDTITFVRAAGDWDADKKEADLSSLRFTVTVSGADTLADLASGATINATISITATGGGLEPYTFATADKITIPTALGAITPTVDNDTNHTVTLTGTAATVAAGSDAVTDNIIIPVTDSEGNAGQIVIPVKVNPATP